jgi:hypothetical protein
VRLRQTVRDLRRDVQRSLHGHRAGDGQLSQRLAVHELHRDERRLALAADLENRNDVGVVERRRRPRLLLEARQAPLVRGERLRQDLQRDLAPEPRVARPIHLSHSARAERREHLEGTEPLTRLERHFVYRSPSTR